MPVSQLEEVADLKAQPLLHCIRLESGRTPSHPEQPLGEIHADHAVPETCQCNRLGSLPAARVEDAEVPGRRG